MILEVIYLVNSIIINLYFFAYKDLIWTLIHLLHYLFYIIFNELLINYICLYNFILFNNSCI